MIIVKNVEHRKDKNGKAYKYLSLFSPERTERIKKHPKGTKSVTYRSKRCGYIAYPVDYTKDQKPDPGANLNKGDKVEGFLVTRKVQPYVTDSGMSNLCTVPVFMSMDDPIEFEIALERAFIRAGKTLLEGEVDYGLINSLEKEKLKIPDSCLVVKHL